MAVGWLIIGLALFLIVVVLFKSQNTVYLFSLLRGKIFYILIIAVILFFAFSMSRVYSLYNLDFSSFRGINEAAKVYFFWLKSVFVNLGDVTGYAVNQDWLTGNSTKR